MTLARLDSPNTAIVVAYVNGAREARDFVRCVNSHDDLLAACKEFVRKCECGEASSRRSYAQMKAAIAKAEANPHD